MIFTQNKNNLNTTKVNSKNKIDDEKKENNSMNPKESCKSQGSYEGQQNLTTNIHDLSLTIKVVEKCQFKCENSSSPTLIIASVNSAFLTNTENLSEFFKKLYKQDDEQLAESYISTYSAPKSNCNCLYVEFALPTDSNILCSTLTQELVNSRLKFSIKGCYSSPKSDIKYDANSEFEVAGKKIVKSIQRRLEYYKEFLNLKGTICDNYKSSKKPKLDHLHIHQIFH